MSNSPPGAHGLLADRYEVEVEIGSGAFATTWRGRDLRLDRTVAIKILSHEFSRDSTYAQRFQREAQTAASISDGNVVDIYDYGQQGDVLFIVMQYIDGEDLKHLITRERSLSAERAREIVLNLLHGLAAIHAAGIIHRDIKPQNILIGRDGIARVADFGIAQQDVDSGLTTVGTTIGTAAYMAPEQAEGGVITPATDLYAVGVVLYEMLTGVLPFEAPTPIALMLAHIQQSPPLPSLRSNGRPIPPDLEGIVMQALAKSPQDRFRSANAMTQALRSASLGMTGSQRTVATNLSGNRSPGQATTVLAGNRPVSGTPPRSQRASGGAPPPTASVRPSGGDERREGAGLGAVVGAMLLVILFALVVFAGYLWWDGRQNNSLDSGDVTPTATVDRPEPTATDRPEPTTADVLIEPASTVPPTSEPTDEPTEPPTSEPTDPPTVTPEATIAAPIASEPPAPTIGPGEGSESPTNDQVIEPIATQ